MAYSASQYTSMYQTTRTISGTDVTGFQDQYDFDNATLYPPPLSDYLYQYADIFTDLNNRMKIYIPPSTTCKSYYLGMYLPSNSTYMFIARMGQPPTVNTAPYSTSLPTSGFSLSQLSAGNCIGRNNSGIMAIVKGYGATSSGWIYIQIIPVSGEFIHTVWQCQMNVAQFMTWYNAYSSWKADGDPSEGNIIPRSYSIAASSRRFTITVTTLTNPPPPVVPGKYKMTAASGSFKVNYLIFTWRPPPITIVPFLNIQCPFCGHSIINITLNIPSYINEP